MTCGGDRRHVNGDKHPLGVVEGATENAATVQALIAISSNAPRSRCAAPLIIDGSKALSKAIRRDLRTRRGHSTLPDTQGAQHLGRLPKSMHAQVRRTLRQAWEMDDAGKAETLLRNLARRLEKDWEGVSASILEGLDEMLTVTKLGLPPELRRSLACTNIIENVMGTVRRVCRNVNIGARRPWLYVGLAPPCRKPPRIQAAQGLQTASLLQAALARARQEPLHRTSICQTARLRRFSISDARFALFNIKWTSLSAKRC